MLQPEQIGSVRRFSVRIVVPAIIAWASWISATVVDLKVQLAQLRASRSFNFSALNGPKPLASVSPKPVASKDANRKER